MSRKEEFDELIRRYASEFNIDPALLASIAEQGSNWDPSKEAEDKSAQGLMQLTPDIQKLYAVADPFDPEQSVRAGANYLSDLFDRFNDNSKNVIAAYRSTPEDVESYGGSPKKEDDLSTYNYVKGIVDDSFPRYAQEYSVDGLTPVEPVGEVGAPGVEPQYAPAAFQPAGSLGPPSGGSYRLILPDGSFTDVPSHVDEKDAMDMAKQKFPDAFKAYREIEAAGGDSSMWDAWWSSANRSWHGIFPALGAAYADFIGDQEMYEKYQQQIAETSEAASKLAPHLVSLEDVSKTYRDDGLFPAMAKLVELGAEQIGSSIGFQTPSIAGGLGGWFLGAAGASLLGAGAVAAVPVGLMAAFAGFGTMWATFLSQNLERAYSEGDKKDVEDLNLLAVAGSAGGQTALNALSYLLIGGFAGTVGVRALLKGIGEAAPGVAKAATGAAMGRNARNLASGAFIDTVEKMNAMGSFKRTMALLMEEQVAEFGQQLLERASAGLPIDPRDQGALDEYIETAIMVFFPTLGMAGLGGVATNWNAARARKHSKGLGETDEQRTSFLRSVFTNAQQKVSSLLERHEADLTKEQKVQLLKLKQGEDFTIKDIENIAKDRNIIWDDDAAFMAATHRHTGGLKGGKYYLDQLKTQKDLRKMYSYIFAMPRQDTDTRLLIATDQEVADVVSRIKKSRKAKTKKGEEARAPSTKITVDNIRTTLGLKKARIADDVAQEISEFYYGKMQDMGLIDSDGNAYDMMAGEGAYFFPGTGSDTYREIIKFWGETGREPTAKQYLEKFGIRSKQAIRILRKAGIARGDIQDLGTQPAGQPQYVLARAPVDTVTYQVEIDGVPEDRIYANSAEAHGAVESLREAEIEAARAEGRPAKPEAINYFESDKIAIAREVKYEVVEGKQKASVVRNTETGDIVKIFTGNPRTAKRNANKYIKNRETSAQKSWVLAEEGGQEIGSFPTQLAARAEASKRRESYKDPLFTGVAPRLTINQRKSIPPLVVEERSGYVVREQRRREDDSLTQSVPVDILETKGKANTAARRMETWRKGGASRAGRLARTERAAKRQQTALRDPEAEAAKRAKVIVDERFKKERSKITQETEKEIETLVLSERLAEAAAAQKEGRLPRPTIDVETLRSIAELPVESRTVEQQKEIDEVVSILQAVVGNMVGGRLLVRMRDSIEGGTSDAQFVGSLKLIEIALDPGFKARTLKERVRHAMPFLTHEVVHYLRLKGFISPSEWATLSRWTKKNNITPKRLAAVNKSREAEGQSPLLKMTYAQYARSLYAGVGQMVAERAEAVTSRDAGRITPEQYDQRIKELDEQGWIDDDYTEEAVAFAWQDNREARLAGEEDSSAKAGEKNIAGLMSRFVETMRKLGNALRGGGFQTSDQVFELMYGPVFKERVAAGKVLDPWYMKRQNSAEFQSLKSWAESRGLDVWTGEALKRVEVGQGDDEAVAEIVEGSVPARAARSPEEEGVEGLEELPTEETEWKMSDETIDQLGHKNYQADAPSVTIKELLQNSFDAIKGALFHGEIQPGEGWIDIDINAEDRTITVRDNGLGMTTKVIQENFFQLGKPYKAGIPTELRSGGLGLAKLVFLFNPDWIIVDTVRDGVKSVVRTTPALIKASQRGEKIPIKRYKTDADNGTTITAHFKTGVLDADQDVRPINFPRLKFVESDWQVGGEGEQVGDVRWTKYVSDATRGIDFFREPLIGDVNVNARFIEEDWVDEDGVEHSGNAITIPNRPQATGLGGIGNSWNPDQMRLETTITEFGWGDVDIYIGTKERDDRIHVSEGIKVLSSGIHQFNHSFVGSENIPFPIILDFKPSVEAQNADYPFSNAREGFRGSVASDIEKINTFISRWIRAAETKRTVEKFAKVERLERVPFDTIVDVEALSKRFAAEGIPIPGLAQDIQDKYEAHTVRVAQRHREDLLRHDKDTSSIDSIAATNSPIDPRSLADSVQIDPDSPIFHNNTNMVVALSDPAVKKLFSEMATLVLEFKEWISVIPGYNVLFDPEIPYAAGIDIDKEHFGVHVKAPYRAFFLNPFLTRARNTNGVATSWWGTLIHEASHLLDPSKFGEVDRTGHGPGHNVLEGDLEAQAADRGLNQVFLVAAMKILADNWDTYFRLKEQYDSYGTENIGTPIESGREFSAPEGQVRGRSGEARDGDRYTEARGERGTGVEDSSRLGDEPYAGRAGKTVASRKALSGYKANGDPIAVPQNLDSNWVAYALERIVIGEGMPADFQASIGTYQPPPEGVSRQHNAIEHLLSDLVSEQEGLPGGSRPAHLEARLVFLDNLREPARRDQITAPTMGQQTLFGPSRHALNTVPEDMSQEQRDIIDTFHLGDNPIPNPPTTLWNRAAKGFIDTQAGSKEWEDRKTRWYMALVNKYQRLKDLGRLIADEAGIKLMADTSVEAAAMMIDRAAGYLAGSLRYGIPAFIDTGGQKIGTDNLKSGFARINGLKLTNRATKVLTGWKGDPVTGTPTYKSVEVRNMYTEEHGGLIPIFSPLAAKKLMSAFFTYARAKRAFRVKRAGKIHVDYEWESIRRGLALADQHPEIAVAHENLQNWNNGLVKFIKDTGVITSDMEAEWTDTSDYIPFYLELYGEGKSAIKQLFAYEIGKRDKSVVDSLVTDTHPELGGVASEAELMEPIEAISKNAMALITGGLKNVALNRAIEQGVIAGWVTPNNSKGKDDRGPDVEVYIDGVKHGFDVKDKLLLDTIVGAFQGNDVGFDSFIHILGKPARFLREMVTRSPGFLAANLLRDSLSIWAMGGGHKLPIWQSIGRLGQSLGKMFKGEVTDTYRILEKGGAIGGWELSGVDPQRLQRMFKQEVGMGSKVASPFWFMWDKLGEASARSEASTRELVYEQTYDRVYKRLEGEIVSKEGRPINDEEKQNIHNRAENEGSYAALEVLNFSRRGNSFAVRFLAGTVPFLNARIQGLDRLARVGINGEGLSGEIDPSEVRATLLRRGIYLATLSSMYALMMYDDEDFENIRPEIRDDNWLWRIGEDTFLAVPIPFEVGVLFKVLPEQAMRLALGDSPRDVVASLRRSFWETLSFNPIPQAFKPGIEMWANKNFFTGEPIVPYFMDVKDADLQKRASTSLASQLLGSVIGASPLHIDNLIRGYTGTLGVLILNVVDAATHAPLAKAFDLSVPPEMGWNDWPIVRRFIKNNMEGGLKTQYYDLREQVHTLVASVNDLKKSGMRDEAKERIEDRQGIWDVRHVVRRIDKKLSRIRQRRRKINESKILTGSQKREALDKLELQENDILKSVPKLRRDADMELAKTNLGVISPFSD